MSDTVDPILTGILHEADPPEGATARPALGGPVTVLPVGYALYLLETKRGTGPLREAVHRRTLVVGWAVTVPGTLPGGWAVLGLASLGSETEVAAVLSDGRIVRQSDPIEPGHERGWERPR